MFLRAVLAIIGVLIGVSSFAASPLDPNGKASTKETMKAAIDFCFNSTEYDFYKMSFENSDVENPQMYMMAMIQEIEADGMNVLQVDLDAKTAIVRIHNLGMANDYLKSKIDQGEIIEMDCLRSQAEKQE